MRDEVKAFFETGKLEEYLMGLSSPEDKREVEHYIDNYPEVKREYKALQEDIEEYANSMAIPAPIDSKADILNTIDTLKNTPKNLPSTAANSSNTNWGWLAGLVALLSLALAGWFWSQNSKANEALNTLQSKYEQVISDCEERSQDIAAMQKEKELLLHAATQLVTLKGDAMGSDFYATAFWNKEQNAAHLNVSHLPAPPDKHCFQIWADVDGKMVNLGVLPVNQSGLVALPFKVNATSLNVTIEPTGGSEHPTVSRLVASVSV